jgi:hypothetical protein
MNAENLRRETLRVEHLADGRTVALHLEEGKVHGPMGGDWGLWCEVVPAQSGAGPGPKVIRGGSREQLEACTRRLTNDEVLDLANNL